MNTEEQKCKAWRKLHKEYKKWQNEILKSQLKNKKWQHYTKNN